MVAPASASGHRRLFRKFSACQGKLNCEIDPGAPIKHEKGEVSFGISSLVSRFGPWPQSVQAFGNSKAGGIVAAGVFSFKVVFMFINWCCIKCGNGHASGAVELVILFRLPKW